MTDLASLIAAIDQDPDDDARYLVLADALIASGDPRGELITLQAELAKRPHDRDLLTAESVALRSAWTDLAPYRRYFREARWRLGFLDTLDIDHLAPPEVVAAVTTSPVARWLRTLRWAGNLKIAARDLAPLANLRRLVPGTTLSDPEFHDLAALPRVDQLHLFGRLSADAIASVPLRALGLAFMYDFTDAHVAATARIATLRELRLQSSAFSDAALEQLGDGLRSLTLVRAGTNSVFQHLARHRLTTLEIDPEARLDAAGLARLEHPTLERLFLDQVANAEAALAALAEHRSLESAYLTGVDYQPVKAETLGRVLALPSLRRLRLSIQGSIEGDVLTETKVTALELRSSRVSPAFAASLARLPLVELHLPQHGTDGWVDDAYLAQLAANPALERLDLPNAIITDRGLRALHGHPRLATLSLNHCRRLTSRGIAELVGELPALCALVLHGIDLDTDALAAIARTNILSLQIHHGNIDDARLAALLPAASTLRELHVAHCPLTLAAIPVLVQFHALDRLSVGYNNHAEEYADEDLASASVLRPLMPHCFMEI